MPEKDCPNGQNGEWQPTRDFYLGNPRSVQIRDICVAILNDFDVLLHDPQAARDEARRGSLYRRLFGLDTKLVELGIVPDMHQELKEDELEKDPVLAAERAAAIIGQEIGKKIVPSEEVQPLIEEFSMSSNGQVYALDLNQRMPKKLRDFLELEYIVFWGNQILAAERPTFSEARSSK